MQEYGHGQVANSPEEGSVLEKVGKQHSTIKERLCSRMAEVFLSEVWGHPFLTGLTARTQAVGPRLRHPSRLAVAVHGPRQRPRPLKDQAAARRPTGPGCEARAACLLRE